MANWVLHSREQNAPMWLMVCLAERVTNWPCPAVKCLAVNGSFMGLQECCSGQEKGVRKESTEDIVVKQKDCREEYDMYPHRELEKTSV